MLDLDKQSEAAEQGCEKWGDKVSRQSQRSESSSVVVGFFFLGFELENDGTVDTPSLVTELQESNCSLDVKLRIGSLLKII